MTESFTNRSNNARKNIRANSLNPQKREYLGSFRLSGGTTHTFDGSVISPTKMKKRGESLKITVTNAAKGEIARTSGGYGQKKKKKTPRHRKVSGTIPSKGKNCREVGAKHPMICELQGSVVARRMIAGSFDLGDAQKGEAAGLGGRDKLCQPSEKSRNAEREKSNAKPRTGKEKKMGKNKLRNWRIKA